MTLVEAKELVKVLIVSTFILTIAILAVMYLFAKITYKKSHKNVKKVHKKATKNVNIVFDIDTKNKTLQELQQERMQMIKILGGI